MPRLSRPSYSRELLTMFFFSIALAIIEGSVIGVFVKQTFTGVVPDNRLNLMVALVAAAPEMANLVSFLWVTWSRGRPKIVFINTLQWIVILLIAIIAFVPRSEPGLYALAGIAIVARVCWSGIITLRPTVWRQNYPRRDRARMVGKFSTVQVVVVALTGLLVGELMDMSPDSYHYFIPAACAVGLLAVVLYRGVRLRGERAMLRQERDQAAAELAVPAAGTRGRRAPRFLMGPLDVWRVLRRDAFFAEFQLWLSIMGLGNLMLNPILYIVLKDQFGMGFGSSALIATTIPLLVMPLAIPVWARLLDRAHVVKFRAVHSWAFVASTLVLLAAMALHIPALLYVGAALQGFAYGGGTLAWNMGHHDFAPPNQTSQYMAAHLTLNGIRGTIGPVAAVALYDTLRTAGYDAAAVVVGLTAATSIIGAIGFIRLKRRMGTLAELGRRGG